MVLYGELCPLSPLSGVDNCRFDRPAENGEIEYPSKGTFSCQRLYETQEVVTVMKALSR
jgi:hypothetical protein